ncbi:hypothetical protein [Oceanobacillus salinisoli]|uniref:hypothetical protein n=1 Tax=Oceanobacillus salinisoli TaxID=2678611 RepID=UPI0012E0E739|nr:hypothetical protein [Oceanobacillus salinisoli]
MVSIVIGIAGVMISILMFVLFIIGLWLSKINSFKHGVYFFLLLIIHEVYSFIAPPLIQKYIDMLMTENKIPIMGMTLGEFVAFLSYIPKIIVLIAFICLIFGLRRLWNLKV